MSQLWQKLAHRTGNLLMVVVASRCSKRVLQGRRGGLEGENRVTTHAKMGLELV